MADQIARRAMRECGCEACRKFPKGGTARDHEAINRVLASLDERQRRLFAGLMAQRRGHGGILTVSEITGMSRTTIRRGISELRTGVGPADGRIREMGGGRKRVEKKTPDVSDRLRDLVEDATAGDPISGLRWTHKSTRRLARALQRQGFRIGANTVARLLKAQKFSLRTNRKRLARTHEPERDRQFHYIAYLRRRFEKQGNPAISIDTKKKELIGLFKNAGKTWRRDAQDVWDHDFPSLARGRAIPFGVYDRQRNSGFVVVGTSHETAEFAADALSVWWSEEGCRRYPSATRWLLEADCGGANNVRTWLWKWALQQLADHWGMPITVAHYPPGASKWNPIEHHLFSQISANWQGEPLRDYETVLGFIASTTNEGGLTCRAVLSEAHYPTKIKVTDEQKRSIRIRRSRVLPQWSYTIHPREKRTSYF